MVDSSHNKAFHSTSNKSYSLPPADEVAVGGVKLIEIQHGQDSYKLWTKKVASYTGDNVDNTNHVLLLHGGPGCNHQYFECFEQFLPPNGFSIYYFDQLDSMFSSQPNKKELWTIANYVEHIEKVRIGLGLEKLTLLGHSWGGMISYEYALRYPDHLHRMIISNMTPSVKHYESYIEFLRAKLPFEVNQKMLDYENKEDFKNPEYEKLANDNFYSKHICQIYPFPDPVDRCFRYMNQGIYNHFQGANEMLCRGAFQDWDVTDRLHQIKTKTLILAAKNDSMSPAEMQKACVGMPNARISMSETGSHMAMYDDQRNYFTALLSFLDE